MIGGLGFCLDCVLPMEYNFFVEYKTALAALDHSTSQVTHVEHESEETTDYETLAKEFESGAKRGLSTVTP